MIKLIASAVFLLFLLSCIPAWITHVIYTISNELYILLAIGAIIPPVGVVHGFMIWFGHGL